MKVHDWLALALKAEGVDTVFGYIAEENQNLFVSLDEVGVRVIQTRHEQPAAGMADGYARATGRLGVCAVGQGPGVAQIGTSLVTMRKKRSPVLLVVPIPPASEPHALKLFRQTEYLEATLERVVTAHGPEDLDSSLRAALEQARSGPVALQVPSELIDRDVDLEAHVPSPPAAAEFPSAAAETLDEVVGALLGVDEPPVILAGAGAAKAGAREELERLAELTGALLATTVQGKGLFEGNPRNLGVMGSLGTELAAELIAQTRCVLAVGCSLNPYTTYHGGLLKNAKVFHVDAVPERIGAITPVAGGIAGDAREVVAALNALVERNGLGPGDWPASRRARLEQAEARIASFPVLQNGQLSHAPGRLDPRDVIRKLDSVLPEDRVVITDAGHFMRWVLDGLPIRDPRDFFWSADFASIGQGLGIATGVAIARPDRPCVLIAGDGGFSMAIQELATLVRYRVPLTIVVWNDGTLGSEYHNLAVQGQPTDLAVISNPPFDEVARAFGCRGLAVSRLEELDRLPGLLETGAGVPLVVDVKIDPEVRHRSKV